jgi:hypothetical protein
VRTAAGRATIRFSIVDSNWRLRRVTPLIPDHGHLVHLFLVGAGLDAFAHLHPVLVDSNTFDAVLPPLPAGRYRVYADMTRESGFAETLTDTVTLAPPSGAWRPSDADDAWAGTEEGGRGTGNAFRLEDGSTMTWDHGTAAIVVGQDAPLAFTVTGPDRRPARLESYMGMAGHLMLARDDGKVFVHLHPLGTISWAAQQTFLLRRHADTTWGTVGRRLTEMQHRDEPFPTPNGVSFPYAFPSPGHYRLWVQVKRGNRILTGVFDTEVH